MPLPNLCQHWLYKAAKNKVSCKDDETVGTACLTGVKDLQDSVVEFGWCRAVLGRSGVGVERGMGQGR